jgi:hypothetical protein
MNVMSLFKQIKLPITAVMAPFGYSASQDKFEFTSRFRFEIVNLEMNPNERQAAKRYQQP